MTTGYPRKACAICCNSTRRSETCGALHPSISLLPSWSLFVFVAILLFVEGQQTTPNSALPVDWAAPWQPTSAGGGGVDRLNYQGLPPTVFAPGGRLYSVERVVQAASALEDESSNLVVAISCQNGLVVVSTLRQSPHLSVQPILSDSSENKQRSKILPKDDPTKQPLWVFDEQDQSPFVIHSPFLSLSTLSSSTSDCPLMAVCAGNAVDSQLLQRKIQRLADRALWDSIHSSHSVTHDNLPFTECQVLARQLADHLQVPTQTVGGRSGRILASAALMFGGANFDSAALPLWRVDPTGQFWSCHAAMIGRGSVEAEQTLLELLRLKSNEASEDPTATVHHGIHEHLQKMSTKEALSLACQVIRKTLEKSSTSYRWRAIAIVRNRSNQRHPFLLSYYSSAELESLVTQGATS